ncbi:hypothetical protein BABINDRAFT_11438 [Babjeviella inositovora NRRL Y-12698]|uniref:Phosphoglycerate mutase-like protein n=1 Tax=Babjeviella inositovora NRRL Y-12698 TaxID=984486 RepID=A0A1E3QZT0_9ASCO|nr:uncharacterized protein BABINDRAFT_11438 [Babjeviella inositovora NRRL Y-12698]ODQ83131.1 hypothetical protein BABINDRAFT_11438 [Babjeviella inositovora NRRL Y-12698]
MTSVLTGLIILVRHGESEGNCDKSVNCHIANQKIRLTATGHQQAALAGIRLRNELKEDDKILFYTSPYLRARQTCTGLINGIEGHYPYEVAEEPRMREQDFGNFQSSSLEMEMIWKERAHYGHFFYRIPDGESAADVYDRVAGFNETLFRQFQQPDFPSVLVLVTHGIWARVFLMKWFRWTYEEFESLRNIPHCQFLNMEREDELGRYELKTQLLKWDDVLDDEIDLEMDNDRALLAELKFNSKGKLDDESLTNVLNAEKSAKKSQREKGREIKKEYEKYRNRVNSNCE